MQKKISPFINWNLLLKYLNKMSKDGYHAYARSGDVYDFEEDHEKRYYYFMDADYVTMFEENKKSLKLDSTEELEVKNKRSFRFASLPQIYRNELEDISQEKEDRKYQNINRFILYLWMAIYVTIRVLHHFYPLSNGNPPLLIISFILTYLVYVIFNFVLRKNVLKF